MFSVNLLWGCWPLLKIMSGIGEQRTCRRKLLTSAFDPLETSNFNICCTAKVVWKSCRKVIELKRRGDGALNPAGERRHVVAMRLVLFGLGEIRTRPVDDHVIASESCHDAYLLTATAPHNDLHSQFDRRLALAFHLSAKWSRYRLSFDAERSRMKIECQ